jgi:hypothetical protein
VFKHNPLNHPLRPVYRLVDAVVGVAVGFYGLVTYSGASGMPAFTPDDTVTTFGLTSNRGFAEICVVVGALVLLTTLVGHNFDHWVAVFSGSGFMLAGGAMLALMRTTHDVLAFTMATCLASFVVGILLFAAGMYIGTGSAEAGREREAERHGGHVPARTAAAWAIPMQRPAPEAVTPAIASAPAAQSAPATASATSAQPAPETAGV